MTESEEAIDRKVEELLRIGRRVQIVLDTKTLAIALFLIVSIVLLFQARQSSAEGKREAKQGLIQSVVNDRDNLESRKVFLLTRDCPVEYFRDLVQASMDHQDIAAVQSPCGTPEADIADIQQQLDAVNKRLAGLEK